MHFRTLQFGGLVSKAAVSQPTGGAQEGEGLSETSGKSYQMPIVVRDPLRRGGKLHPQDASSVDIHLPSQSRQTTSYPKGFAVMSRK